MLTCDLELCFIILGHKVLGVTIYHRISFLESVLHLLLSIRTTVKIKFEKTLELLVSKCRISFNISSSSIQFKTYFPPGHPWVQVDGVAPYKPLDSAVLSRLKQFSALDKLKEIALRVCFCILTSKNGEQIDHSWVRAIKNLGLLEWTNFSFYYLCIHNDKFRTEV